MSAKDSLLEGIADRSAAVAVVGVGYVGLPLAVAFAGAGFSVTCIDNMKWKIDALNKGQSYIQDVSSETLELLLAQGLLRASADYTAIQAAGVVIICVPTPLRKSRDPDISHIVDAAVQVAGQGVSGKLIVLESTTYPGTTEEVLLPRLSAAGDRVGEDFFLAYSPERIDPGRTDFVMANTPKVVGGMTADCLQVAAAFYQSIVETIVPVSTTATAEMVKLLENTFRSVNIGLVNELALMCNRLGLDVWEVVEAAATKPYGFMPFFPGPGLGGHCIPIDPHYLSWKLRSLDYNARFIELASDINAAMPEFVANLVADALNGEAKAVRGSTILMLGVAYKPNVGDVRESPALDLIHLLLERGADVRYHDPVVSLLEAQLVPATAVELTAENIRNSDCLVVITNHDGYDWPWIVAQARLIVDTRNALHGLTGKHIVRL